MSVTPRHTAILLVLALSLFVPWFKYLPHQDEDQDQVQLDGDSPTQTASDTVYDRLMIEGFSIKEQQGKDQVFTLSAQTLIHRKRKAQFFVYQNLKEISLHDAHINLSAVVDPAQKGRLIIPFNRISKSFESFGSLLPSTADFWAGNSDIDLDIVSRVLFDGLVITIDLPDKRQLSIHADSALVPTTFQYLVFSGNVRLESTAGQSIVASQAVWSCIEGGFFFPNGHTLENRQDNDPAFYDVTLNSKLTRRTPTLVVDYADPLETKEIELQKLISKRMPVYARMIFGFPINP